MTHKKGKLSHRKNRQYPSNVARAARRQQRQIQVASLNPSPMSTGGLLGSDFEGFDIPPLKKSIRVLSLFDGIGTALHVLMKLRFHIEVYFSSETDEKALKLQRYLYQDRITMLGSVTDITENKLDSLGEVNLLIGGSPCTDLSQVNPNRRGLTDPESTGVLFFDYVRILRYLKLKAATRGFEFYWLFENTAKMDRSNRLNMSRYLECEPISMNSKVFFLLNA